MVLRPDEIRVEDLLIRNDRNRQEGQQHEEKNDRYFIAAAQFRFRLRWRASLHFFDNGRIGRQIFFSKEINRETDQHSDAGGVKTQGPADFLTKCPGNERRGDDSGVNEDVINLKGIGAAIVAGRIERADLTGEIAFETTDPNQKTHKSEQETCVQTNQELADGHKRRADYNGECSPKPAIGD